MLSLASLGDPLLMQVIQLESELKCTLKSMHDHLVIFYNPNDSIFDFSQKHSDLTLYLKGTYSTTSFTVQIPDVTRCKLALLDLGNFLNFKSLRLWGFEEARS